jgi:hypothetical protein
MRWKVYTENKTKANNNCPSFASQCWCPRCLRGHFHRNTSVSQAKNPHLRHRHSRTLVSCRDSTIKSVSYEAKFPLRCIGNARLDCQVSGYFTTWFPRAPALHGKAWKRDGKAWNVEGDSPATFSRSNFHDGLEIEAMGPTWQHEKETLSRVLRCTSWTCFFLIPRSAEARAIANYFLGGRLQGALASRRVFSRCIN